MPISPCFRIDTNEDLFRFIISLQIRPSLLAPQNRAFLQLTIFTLLSLFKREWSPGENKKDLKLILSWRIQFRRLLFQQTNPMFHKKSRRLQRQASFSGVASKLMDATSEKSRKLSRQINKMARVQEEKELQEKREQEEAAQEEKKKKEEGFARSIITRKLSIFGSYRRMSFSTRKPVIIVEVSNHPPSPPPPKPAPQSTILTPFLQTSLFLERFSPRILTFKYVFLMVDSIYFFFWSLSYYGCTHICASSFRWRKYSKKMPQIKINWPVKTPLRGLSMGVARIGLLAKTDYHLGEIRTSRGLALGLRRECKWRIF